MNSAGLEYGAIRQLSLEIINELVGMGYKNERIYYAGKTVRSREEFDSPTVSNEKNIKALKSSKYFIMLYPQKINSASVVMEAYAALALKIRSIYFVQEGAVLPYMLREVYQNLNEAIVRQHEYTSVDDLMNKIKKKEIKGFLTNIIK